MTKKHQKLLELSKEELSLQTGFPITQAKQFNELLFSKGQELYRDLPWRNTRDPYAIWISEVMLQQTQVSRVLERWETWLELFPTVDALASASQAEVLQLWQGLGYNRRALMLKRAADYISEHTSGKMPDEVLELEALPGIGPATAAGIVAFAYDKPSLYLETNVRSVLLHEFFTDQDQVSDEELYQVLALFLPQDNYRSYYYAFLDYGAHLKLIMPNPSRRSKHHATQSKFEGSHRQKRSFLLKQILSTSEEISFSELAYSLNTFEREHDRESLSDEYIKEILDELIREGFVKKSNLNYLSK